MAEQIVSVCEVVCTTCHKKNLMLIKENGWAMCTEPKCKALFRPDKTADVKRMGVLAVKCACGCGRYTEVSQETIDLMSRHNSSNAAPVRELVSAGWPTTD